jgi:hypothetical protein
MMMNSIKHPFLLLATMCLISACVNDSYTSPTAEECTDPGLTKTKEVSEIYAVAQNPTTTAPSTIPNTPTYTEDDIIEAYVISSDEGGNFYKSMYCQPTDGSKGFNLSIDEVNVYTKGFEPGKKVFLKLKGLAYANPSSYAIGLIFGWPPTTQYNVDRIPTLEYSNYFFASCDTIDEDEILHKINISDVDTTYLNTLIEIDDVQFTGESAAETYDLDRTDDYDSNTYITQDGSETLIVRTSRYANFAGYTIPEGRGKIRGVLTKYGSYYQLVLRTERDVTMEDARIDYQPTLLGDSMTYLSTFTEDFESYTPTTTGTSFPNYENNAEKGGRYWDVKSYSSNQYLQMTAYGSGGSNKAYLAIPIAFTPGNKFSFKTKDGYYNGDVLKVYYTTDYVPGGSISEATLVDITSRFTISSGSTAGYASYFVSSGNYTIPTSLSGNGFFIFEYSTVGSPEITSTIQIDDISVN